MVVKTLFALASLVTFASAHFQISYPAPRGPYVSDAQVEFCDGYPNVGNRTDFPLSNGLIALDNRHTAWTASVLISIEHNPSNFSVFNTSTSGIQLPYAVDWFSSTGSGDICIPVDIASLNIEGVDDGSHVTLQAMFAGSHGNLFQCVDLTLRANATVPSDLNCTRTINGTVDTAPSATGATPTDTDSGTQHLVTGSSGLLGLAVALLLL